MKENYVAHFQPPKKRPKKLPAPKGKQRFYQMVSSEELESILKGLLLKKNNTKKEVGTFNINYKQWIASRNEHGTDEPIDIDILSKLVDLEYTQLCRALCLCVVEARKGNSKPYLSKTVYY